MIDEIGVVTLAASSVALMDLRGVITCFLQLFVLFSSICSHGPTTTYLYTTGLWDNLLPRTALFGPPGTSFSVCLSCGIDCRDQARQGRTQGNECRDLDAILTRSPSVNKGMDGYRSPSSCCLLDGSLDVDMVLRIAGGCQKGIFFFLLET